MKEPNLVILFLLLKANYKLLNMYHLLLEIRIEQENLNPIQYFKNIKIKKKKKLNQFI